MASKQVLLSFIGNNDCFIETSPGAIISILKKMSFDVAYLLYNHDKYLKPAGAIIEYANHHFPKLVIRLKGAPAENPTDYNTVYPAMFQAVSSILEEEPDAGFTISLTSGTPVMHACWIFLQQGGVIDGRLIQVSRESGISEVSFELDDFPEIRKPERIKAEITRLSRENAALRNRMGSIGDDIIGESPPMIQMKEQIRLFAEGAIPVLIRGETGTGKELVAEALHYGGPRKEKPLVRVNCGAIPAELFESTFFGHKKALSPERWPTMPV